MNKGYKQIFWGFILLSFSIDVGYMKIIPSFLSCIIIWYGIKRIAQVNELKIFKKSYKFCEILVGISFIVEAVCLVKSIKVMDYRCFAVVIFSITETLEMLMVYYLIKGSYEIFKENNLLRIKNNKIAEVYLAVEVIEIILLNLALVSNLQILMIISTGIKLILRIWIILICWKLRKAQV